MTPISVITTTRDNFASLKITGENLRLQDPSVFEWVIYDGSRTEERETIEAYANRMSEELGCNVKFMHGIDDGFYPAAEMAMSHAGSDYVLLLNAGDLLVQTDILARVAAELKAHAPDVLHGQNVYVNAQGKAELHKGRPAVQMLADIDKKTHYRYFPDMVCQQAIVYRRDLFERCGFSQEYSIAADHEHFLRCARVGAKMHYWPHPVCVYFAGGFSFSYMQNCKLEWLRLQMDQVIAGSEDEDDCTARLFQTLETYLPTIGDGIA